jgi:hypothetical protein
MLDRIITALLAGSMALLGWLYLRSRDREMLDGQQIPVQVTLPADQADHYEVEVGGHSEVPVSFVGPPSRIRELRAMLQRGEMRVEVTVSVPDNRLDDARYQETVRVEANDLHPPPGVTPLVVEGRNRILVTLHKLVERRLPVRYQHAAEERIAHVKLEPETVLVRGPQEIFDRVRDIPTQPYALPARGDTAAQQEVSTTVTVPLVRELEGRPVRVTPDAVTARLKLKPPQRTYELTEVPIHFLCAPNLGLRPLFGDERAGKMTLRLSGPAGEETPSVVAYIDLCGRRWEPGLYEESVRLHLPRDFQLNQPAPRPVAFQLVPAGEPAGRAGEGGRPSLTAPPN